MKTYLLIENIHHDGGSDLDWTETVKQEIIASDDLEAVSKARIVVNQTLEKIGIKNKDNRLHGFDALLYGPPVKSFFYQKAIPGKPARPEEPAVPAVIIEE